MSKCYRRAADMLQRQSDEHLQHDCMLIFMQAGNKSVSRHMLWALTFALVLSAD